MTLPRFEHRRAHTRYPRALRFWLASQVPVRDGDARD